jgi:hypothetical protein
MRFVNDSRGIVKIPKFASTLAILSALVMVATLSGGTAGEGGSSAPPGNTTATQDQGQLGSPVELVTKKGKKKPPPAQANRKRHKTTKKGKKNRGKHEKADGYGGKRRIPPNPNKYGNPKPPPPAAPKYDDGKHRAMRNDPGYDVSPPATKPGPKCFKIPSFISHQVRQDLEYCPPGARTEDA